MIKMEQNIYILHMFFVNKSNGTNLQLKFYICFIHKNLPKRQKPVGLCHNPYNVRLGCVIYFDLHHWDPC